MSTVARKILVVEDEKVVQLHLSKIVESSGHELVGAVDRSADAIENASRSKPDLVLMDIRLAEGDDGIQCANVLSNDWGASIVFITAHSDSETLERAMPIEASGFLVKPFRAAEVTASISNALATRDREQRARHRDRALSSAVDALEEALFVIDAHGVIGFANPRGKVVSNWLESSGESKTVFDFIAAEEHNRVRACIERALASEVVVSLSRIELTTGAGLGSRIRFEPITESGDQSLLVTLSALSAGAEPESCTPRDDSQPRLLVYSHDTFGLGHIRRCMNLVRAMTDRIGELSTLLVTGSPVAHKFELPPRTDYLKLPAVRKISPDAYEPRSLSMSEEGILTLRRNLLLRTVRDYSPSLLLVDHSPTGMNGELLPVLSHLREQGTCTRILGLRDIIDSPERVAKRWEKENMINVLRQDYDRVVIYGSKEVYDTAENYGFPTDLKKRTRFVNYVSQHTAVARANAATEIESGLVVVSIGGGDGGGDSIVRPFLEMLRTHATRLGIHAEVLLGPFVPAAQREELCELAEGSPVVLHDFLPDPTPLFARAELVVSTAGYNVSAELVAHAHRALLIPRVVHREEQLIRARRLAEMGLVDFLHPMDATPTAIAERIEALLSLHPTPLDEARSACRVPLDGADRMAELVQTLVRNQVIPTASSR